MCPWVHSKVVQPSPSVLSRVRSKSSKFVPTSVSRVLLAQALHLSAFAQFLPQQVALVPLSLVVLVESSLPGWAGPVHPVQTTWLGRNPLSLEADHSLPAAFHSQHHLGLEGLTQESKTQSMVHVGDPGSSHVELLQSATARIARALWETRSEHSHSTRLLK